MLISAVVDMELERGDKWQNCFTQALLDSRGTALEVQDHMLFQRTCVDTGLHWGKACKFNLKVAGRIFDTLLQEAVKNRLEINKLENIVSTQ